MMHGTQKFPTRLVKRNINPISRSASKSRADSRSYNRAGNTRNFDVVERLASLFDPDSLAPAQFFSKVRRKTLVEPERKLSLAILEDAIDCFQDNVLVSTGKGKKLFDDAQQWFLAENTDWLFSFRNICELLAIDPEYLRTGLMRWKAQQLAHHYRSGASSGKRCVTPAGEMS